MVIQPQTQRVLFPSVRPQELPIWLPEATMVVGQTNVS